ncbi:hypothetical protein [Paenarthrobacter sp. FR1]|uniref:hypothetical protein n=1 Tax=Paenarthrobacter sp. FR1 TaxID=3439548 RepID=UPI003DA305BF
MPWHSGGTTTVTNGAGLCEACNHTKENPGWTASPINGHVHTFELRTPTGHAYRSQAPPLPGRDRSAGDGRAVVDASSEDTDRAVPDFARQERQNLNRF